MKTWILITVLVVALLAIVGLILAIFKKQKSALPGKTSGTAAYNQVLQSEIENIFTNDFREELRNHGRLYFENIISKNAMFLENDLRLTTAQLNEYMKTETISKLEKEFAKFDQALQDATKMAVDSVQKANSAIDDHRKLLDANLQKEITAHKAEIIKHFEDNMTEIVSHYIKAAIGNQMDLDSQLNLIVADLQANKQAIVEDITNGS